MSVRSLLHRGTDSSSEDFGFGNTKWVASRHQDAVTLLMLFVVLQLGLPAQYVIGPLGGAGGPATVLGLGLLLWWAVHTLAYGGVRAQLQDRTRWLLVWWLFAVLCAYLAATIRPIDSTELSAADRGLLSVFSWAGVVFLIMDGIRTRARLERLLRTVSVMGGLVALLGLVQFQTGLALTNYLKLPGLSENGVVGGVASREGFLRPAGTATHPIEFGVVLAVMLPLTLYFAMNDTHRGKFARWWPVACIGLAVPVSVSRSAIICVVVAFLVLLPAWSRVQRRVAGLAVLVLMGVVFIAIPGMIGTIFGLFSAIGGDDTSVQSRTDSYALAAQFISRNPIFGRGFGTFLPSYRILDNQYLGTMIEVGAFGLLALLALHYGSVGIALGIRRSSTDPATRLLAQTLAASTAAGCISFAFFDAFSFPQAASLTFVTIGAIGALRRLSVAEERARVADEAGLDEPDEDEYVEGSYGPDEFQPDEFQPEEFEPDGYEDDSAEDGSTAQPPDGQRPGQAGDADPGAGDNPHVQLV